MQESPNEADANCNQKQKEKSWSNNGNNKKQNSLDKEKKNKISANEENTMVPINGRTVPKIGSTHAYTNDIPPTSNASSNWNTSNKDRVKSMESGATLSETKAPIIRFQDNIEQMTNQPQAAWLHEKSQSGSMPVPQQRRDTPNNYSYPTQQEQPQSHVQDTDQPILNNGPVSWKLAKALSLPTFNNNSWMFIIATCTFTSVKVLKLSDAMLPCLFTKH